VGVSRAVPEGADLPWIAWAPADGAGNLKEKLAGQTFSAVVWAQGKNGNDTAATYEQAHHLEMYQANVVYILESLRALLDGQQLQQSTRLCIISSIWQNIVRQNKLSYCITKSAIEGLVGSVAADLGPQGVLINAVLPGPLDTPMTRANLRSEQLESLEKSTPLRSLPNLQDVCGLTEFLCSSRNTGITGQFIAADRGFSYVRYV